MANSSSFTDITLIIKGAGDVASGVAHRLYSAGFKRILMLEIEKPLCVRRTVSFCETVYDGTVEVEGVRAEFIPGPEGIEEVWSRGSIAVAIDPRWTFVSLLKPRVVIDSIMAKRNLGTTRDEAPTVIGIGPGFSAPADVHAVVESKRGHDLGKAIYQGSAEPYTGVPGAVMGYTTERVLRSPVAGLVRSMKKIGDQVGKGDLVLYVGEQPVYASFDGVLRGLIREIEVDGGEKIGDIDPRGLREYCYTISDKARAIGGGVLECVMHALT